MAEAKKYEGSCHCGKVRYEVELSLGDALECNCSICGRTGAKMYFVPQGAFTLKSGQDAMTDYQFGKKSIHHRFCSTCGVRSFAQGASADGSPSYMVNARCLEGVDPWSLKTNHHDGKSR